MNDLIPDKQSSTQKLKTMGKKNKRERNEHKSAFPLKHM